MEFIRRIYFARICLLDLESSRMSTAETVLDGEGTITIISSKDDIRQQEGAETVQVGDLFM